MTFVEYKQLNPIQRFAYDFKKTATNAPKAVANFFKGLVSAVVGLFTGIVNGFKNIIFFGFRTRGFFRGRRTTYQWHQ